MSRNKIVILSILIIALIITLGRIKYIQVDFLVDRLDDSYVLLHNIIEKNERLGVYRHNIIEDSLYNKNEGWLLSNTNTYCSNRLIDNIERISEETNTDKYLVDNQYSELEIFKQHLVELNELCVNVRVINTGERIMEPSLFISREHKIWRSIN